mmetsp:Transcript_40234/g.58817  ORF Transcript_40234/g.58817 Transcript_40234/m.58817 type:complete len:217 (+) Transcript_40234:289-939(+)
MSLSITNTNMHSPASSILTTVQLIPKEVLFSLSVSAMMTAGGAVRFNLPSYISSVPITLHTLAAVLGGMIFGSDIGVYGAVIHLMFFFWRYHSKLNSTSSSSNRIHNILQSMPSLGYIIGMIPCAYIAGYHYHNPCLVPQKVGSIALVAAMAQGVTVLCGVSWLYFAFPEQSIGTLVRRNVFPFIPGLIVKSLLAGIAVCYFRGLCNIEFLVRKKM